ncbi:uncharacterized protein LAESUDRAFT_80628 [Laetiporus sulphureus 93-53]|uniref:Uncharacterized protein n=1 Tax=Laetiporus sulphureus 93-53 TaxID=1314785 RepID=A0A165F1Y0_9APHY|nr:uncharacterized protein LAESUDRAFT_80628 [Laetiporus sulphureus 93-53]KZT08202.1 hypothetical protein LAESUDRAFT_80628 [Laetiporus sulphureus 93-53]
MARSLFPAQSASLSAAITFLLPSFLSSISPHPRPLPLILCPRCSSNGWHRRVGAFHIAHCIYSLYGGSDMVSGCLPFHMLHRLQWVVLELGLRFEVETPPTSVLYHSTLFSGFHHPLFSNLTWSTLSAIYHMCKVSGLMKHQGTTTIRC